MIENKIKKKDLSYFGLLGLSIIIFVLALLPRLYFLFFVTNPQNAGIGWYNDTYHHWQIAYLTKEVGLSEGFLRLWDFKGLEYFWGPLHPLLSALAFTITGSVDIVVSRLISVVSGSIAIVLLFFMVKRYFNFQAALGATLLAIFNPVGIFTDISGMQEPLGIALFLAGIYFWPKKSVLAAIFWGLAAMVRAEYWIFTLGLVLAIFFWKEKLEQKLLVGFFYLLLIGLYMKYLLDYTGNPIYPVWWNFLGNAVGEWQAEIPLTAEQSVIRNIFGGVLILSLVGILITIWKKLRFYLFILLGLGNFAFLGFFVGFTEYLKSYLPRFWVDRIFWIPYLFLGFLISIVLFWLVPKHLNFLKKVHYSVLPWLVFAVIIFAIQFLWTPIWHYYNPTLGNNRFEQKAQLANKIANYYSTGKILIPEGDELLTYTLVRNGVVGGKNLLGQMFDPFFYIEGDPFESWDETNRKIVLDWIKDEQISIIIIPSERERYKELVRREENLFNFLDDSSDFGYTIYRVELSNI